MRRTEAANPGDFEMENHLCRLGHPGRYVTRRSMTWPKELDSQPESPATDDDIPAFVESVFAPLTVEEIKRPHTGIQEGG